MTETEGYRIKYFITSEKTIDNMKIVMHSEPVQKSFTDIKEAQKFIDDLVKNTQKENSFFHYNLEELQSVLLESRGKITRDGKMKMEIKK